MLSLRIQHVARRERLWNTYPTAPVPNVMRSTAMLPSKWKFSRALRRSA